MGRGNGDSDGRPAQVLPTRVSVPLELAVSERTGLLRARLYASTELVLVPVGRDVFLAVALVPEGGLPCAAVVGTQVRSCGRCPAECAHLQLLQVLAGDEEARVVLERTLGEALSGAVWHLAPERAGPRISPLASVAFCALPDGGDPFVAVVRVRSGGYGYALRIPDPPGHALSAPERAAMLPGYDLLRGEARPGRCDRCGSTACALPEFLADRMQGLTETIDAETKPIRGELRQMRWKTYLHEALLDGERAAEYRLMTSWRIDFGTPRIRIQIDLVPMRAAEPDPFDHALAITLFDLSPDQRVDCPLCRRRPCVHDQLLLKKRVVRAA